MSDTSTGDVGTGRAASCRDVARTEGAQTSDTLGRRQLLRAAAGGVPVLTAVRGVPVTRAQDAGTVFGIVTNLVGDPVEDASVRLFDGATEVGSTQTSDDGQYSLVADPGTYELVVERDQFGTVSETVTIESGEQTKVDVTLGPPEPGAVVGTVVDESGGLVVGAAVTLLDGDTEVAVTETDENGQYALPADTGTYALEVRQTGFKPVTQTVTVISGEASVLNAVLSFGPPSLPGVEDPPRDLDGDGLFEDIDGDGTLTIFDVQIFFTNFGAPVVQNNPAAFNFSGTDPTTVSIFDVQALFDLLNE